MATSILGHEGNAGNISRRLVFSTFLKYLTAENVSLKVFEFATKSTNLYVTQPHACLLYTSDAADEGLGVDLGGRRIIKKKTISQVSVQSELFKNNCVVGNTAEHLIFIDASV